ncbi:MAG TPA: serine protein kinase RIO [Thermoplasmata archaeon]
MPNPIDLVFPQRKERFEDRRREGSDRKLLDEFFDHPTLLAVSRLISQGQFESLDYPISTGKEGGVFRATTPDGYRAVKVYRIGNAIFRRIPPYALEELRREASQGNFRRLVFAWTRREHTILRALHTARVRAPETYGYFRNILVMEFVGVEGVPCPRIRDAVLPDVGAFYEVLVEQIRRMTVDAHLVHGDLSPYNVLLLEDRPVLIDVAQSIPTSHPQAKELLLRDVTNFARYFRHLGLKVSAPAFFEAVGGPSVGPKGS